MSPNPKALAEPIPDAMALKKAGVKTERTAADAGESGIGKRQI